MFGLGVWVGHELAEDHYHHYHHHVHHYSYGCGARYDYHHGGYYRSAHAYGPYGGAGRGAAFNPATGTHARGAYRYGPRGGAFAREAYNPHTDRYAGQVGAKNPYGSWGRSVVSDGDDWARGGHRSNWEKSAAGFETSEGARGVAGRNKRTGESGYIAQDKHGDVYVGRDGNIYKKEDGAWQQRENAGWSSTQQGVSTTQANRSNSRAATTSPSPSSRQADSRMATTTTQTPRTRPQSAGTTRQSLDRDYQARRKGNERTRNFGRSSRGSGGRSSRFRR